MPRHQRNWQADAEQVNDELRPSHRGLEGDWCVQIQVHGREARRDARINTRRCNIQQTTNRACVQYWLETLHNSEGGTRPAPKFLTGVRSRECLSRV